MKPIRVTKRVIRRFLLETQQLLSSPDGDFSEYERPSQEQVLGMLRKLECVQLDPVSAVRPNQHLVMAARMQGYKPEMLNELLKEHQVFEYFANAACVIPIEDYPIFEPVRRRLHRQLAERLEAIRPVVDEVLTRLETEGPLPAKAFKSDQKVKGYWDKEAKTKASSHAINLLMDASVIRIVGREGNQRLFDLTTRSVPAELHSNAEAISETEAYEELMQKYFRAYRVFEPSDFRFGWQKLNAKQRRETVESRVRSGELIQLEIEEVKQPYFIMASDLDRLLVHQNLDPFIEEAQKEKGGHSVNFLPPLDNLLWSRKRLEDLFEFEYRWEIYTPAIKRKFGYYAMPILAGDQLIGRMDPRLDNKTNHLTVELLQIDPNVEYTPSLSQSVEQAVERFAHLHGAKTFTVNKLRTD